MKQTAVEWLIEKLKNVEYNPLQKNGYSIAEERLFNQAKEMEKQQKGYSEEDLISLLEFNYKKETNQLGTLRKDYSQKIIKEWFEQFKKK